MEDVQLVHQLVLDFDGEEYLVEVYCRADGHHFARTAFSSQDVIICDGSSLEEALLRHRELLPLAVHSRQMHASSRLIN
jgi:hypothetical protein